MQVYVIICRSPEINEFIETNCSPETQVSGGKRLRTGEMGPHHGSVYDHEMAKVSSSVFYI